MFPEEGRLVGVATVSVGRFVRQVCGLGDREYEDVVLSSCRKDSCLCLSSTRVPRIYTGIPRTSRLFVCPTSMVDCGCVDQVPVCDGSSH